MAIAIVGDITVDLTIPQLNEFPPVDIPAGVGRMFGLSTLPNPVPLGDRGFFLVIPVIQPGNLDLERPRLTEWYPKNRIFSFKFSAPTTLDDPLTTVIALYPIIPFGNFVANPVSIRLFYEDSLNEPSNLIV